jgi:hypothetical protein
MLRCDCPTEAGWDQSASVVYDRRAQERSKTSLMKSFNLLS